MPGAVKPQHLQKRVQILILVKEIMFLFPEVEQGLFYDFHLRPNERFSEKGRVSSSCLCLPAFPHPLLQAPSP